MGDLIQLQATKKDLSALAGMSLFSSTFDRVVNAQRWTPLLPVNKITPKSNSFAKLKAMTLGLVAGADCIDDLDRLGQDPAFQAANGDVVCAARTYDDFLQRFSHHDTRGMNAA